MPIDDELKRRAENGKRLAKQFPELKGLAWAEFLVRLAEVQPDLDFVTASEMYDALNPG
jgi:hypothetical protein